MSEIKKILGRIKDKNSFLRYGWYLFRQPYYCYLEKNNQKEANLRKEGKVESKFQSLLKFKNKHKGERCFIVATGPSLLISDLELLENEITFGMNSIPKLFSQTKWRPTYFGVQDINVYLKMESVLLDTFHGNGNVFISDTISNRFNVPKEFNVFPLDTAYNFNQLEIEKYFAMFSDDAYSVVYDGYSITYSLIQIAVYMGFKEIYLLGVDCSYKRGAKNHIVESGNDDKNEEKNYEKMTTAYKVAKQYTDDHNIKIVNCTRGGMLEVFTRKSLEEVISNE